MVVNEEGVINLKKVNLYLTKIVQNLIPTMKLVKRYKKKLRLSVMLYPHQGLVILSNIVVQLFIKITLNALNSTEGFGK